MRGDVLDVGLLKESEPRGNRVRNIPARELQLHLHRVKVRPVQNRHVGKTRPLLMQLQNPLRHKSGLLAPILQSHHRRFHPSLPHRFQILGKLFWIMGDRVVRQIQDLRNAAIIRLQSDHLRPGMSFGETQDVLHLRPPPRVNALGIVPHRHDLMVPAPDRIDKVGLQTIRILILIHQHMLKSGPVPIPQLPLLLQQPEWQG